VDDDATGGAAGHSEVGVFALVEAIAPAAAGPGQADLSLISWWVRITLAC
jgi:hypothetical protein